MVRLYRSPIPVGRRGSNFLAQIISTCLPNRVEERGGGIGTLCSALVAMYGISKGKISWAESVKDFFICLSIPLFPLKYSSLIILKLYFYSAV
jgi:hypothetical protein